MRLPGAAAHTARTGCEFARSPTVATSYPSRQNSPPHNTRFTAGFRRKISRAVRLLNLCTIRPGATFGCALQSRWT